MTTLLRNLSLLNWTVIRCPVSSRKSDSTIVYKIPIKAYKHNTKKDANRSEQFKTVYTGLKARLKISENFENLKASEGSKYA